MTIHHATIKSAASKGFALTQDDDVVIASHLATGSAVSLDTEGFDSDTDAAKEAWAICGDIVDWNADPAHAGYRVDQEDGLFVIAALVEGEWQGVSEGHETLQEALDAYEEMDGEANEAVDGEEEEERSGSVVPDGYKKLYREIGVRGQDNGDFLAAAMARYCVLADDKVDCDRVELLASRNGVDYPLDGYNTGSRGWQGRYRMTVRNKLAKAVADEGFLIVPASMTGADEGELTLAAPQEFRDKYATKPKTKKAKKAQADAAAELAAPEDETPA